MNKKLRRLLRAFGVSLLWLGLLFGLMQLVPYGRTHDNPPTTLEPVWDSPRTRELAKRACFDCHSNETHWPGYANVAPFSWVMMYDVNSARSVVNFSEWTRRQDLAPYSGQSVKDGNMPPAKYKLAHPEANLTKAETDELWRGLDATLGRAPEGVPMSQ